MWWLHDPVPSDTQVNAERWAQYRWEVSNKRRAENEENKRRWRQNRELFLQSQENLLCLLRGKEQRSAEMLHRREELRVGGEGGGTLGVGQGNEQTARVKSPRRGNEMQCK